MNRKNKYSRPSPACPHLHSAHVATRDSKSCVNIRHVEENEEVDRDIESETGFVGYVMTNRERQTEKQFVYAQSVQDKGGWLR
jgi:hypothetical protein